MAKLMIVNFLLSLILGLLTNCTKPDYEIIEKKPYMGGQYYVATWGDDENPGTFKEPFASLQKAMNVSQPGDTTYIRGGVYHITTSQSINPDRRHSTAVSGTRENPVHYYNYPGEKPIFDASGNEGLFPAGIHMNNVQYIKFRGITVRNVFQNTIHRDPAELANGWAMSRSANLTFENCVAHDINGRGWFGGSGAWNEWDGPDASWDYDTTIWINCDAYNLHDPLSATPGNGADGWKVHGYQGNVFIWEGCRAWNYSDDGFDASGSAYKYFYNCWAMATDKYRYLEDAEGNGFKCASLNPSYYFPEHLDDTILVKYVNCLAVFNPRVGFYNNIVNGSRKQNNAFYFNNLAYANGVGIACWSGRSEGRPHWNTSKFRNNISWGSTQAEQGFDPIYEVQIFRVLYDHNDMNTWKPTGRWPGWKYNDDFALEDAAFTSLDSLTIIREMTAPRKPDGSLPDITWARLVPNSDMKGAGENVGMSATPDLGVDWDFFERMQGYTFFDFP